MPDTPYTLVARRPSAAEYIRLRAISGLDPFAEPAVAAGLEGTLYAVVIEREGATVGMGHLVGDGGCFFQICDIAVDPAH